uniref:MARVEL domain containing 2b n=1 Tax=Oryzias sinensis TaxID=183150 RepID=A0A8C7Z0Q2_9TELE
MSSRGFGRFDRVRDFTIYDEVAADPPYLDTQLPPPPPPPTTLNGMAKVPALSLDPLPPPPLPDQPAVGPESFYSPSDSEPPEGDRDAMDIKPVRRFIPDSVKNFFRGSRGVPCSPPNSAPPIPFSPRLQPSLHNTSTQTYQERVEEYHLRYAYMKSWAGLLRILGAVQLLLGAAVFACVCAYVHKDNEWFNMFGYSQPQLYGGLGGGVGGYGARVCLKLWRHEAARMRREAFAQELDSVSRASDQTPLPTVQPDIMNAQHFPVGSSLMTPDPEILQGHIPAGHIPKPVVIADYIVKYPSIHSAEDRDRYKAVFTDQYAEYRDIHKEVEVMAKKFEEMDRMMQDLASRPSISLQEQERINKILMEYQMKKADPTYLEKRDRCEYLKNKLSHIKQKIQEYDQAAG